MPLRRARRCGQRGPQRGTRAPPHDVARASAPLRTASPTPRRRALHPFAPFLRLRVASIARPRSPRIRRPRTPPSSEATLTPRVSMTTSLRPPPRMGACGSRRAVARTFASDALAARTLLGAQATPGRLPLFSLRGAAVAHEPSAQDAHTLSPVSAPARDPPTPHPGTGACPTQRRREKCRPRRALRPRSLHPRGRGALRQAPRATAPPRAKLLARWPGSLDRRRSCRPSPSPPIPLPPSPHAPPPPPPVLGYAPAPPPPPAPPGRGPHADACALATRARAATGLRVPFLPY